MRRLMGLILLGCTSCPLYAQDFELFVTGADDYTQPGVSVYQVNGGDRVMAEINDQLKRDGITREEDGERYVTEQLKHALANQAIGLVKAAKYQLKYFPALVIDGEYVIYGTTSVDAYDRLKTE